MDRAVDVCQVGDTQNCIMVHNKHALYYFFLINSMVIWPFYCHTMWKVQQAARPKLNINAPTLSAWLSRWTRSDLNLFSEWQRTGQQQRHHNYISMTDTTDILPTPFFFTWINTWVCDTAVALTKLCTRRTQHVLLLLSTNVCGVYAG